MEMILTGMQEDARERFAAAVTAHRHAMYRAARALLDSDADAEDAVSEATLRAWQAFGRLREKRALKGWLIKITVNCAYEHRRKGARVTYTDDLEPLACGGPARPRPVGRGLPSAGGSSDRDRAVLLRGYDHRRDRQNARRARRHGAQPPFPRKEPPAHAVRGGIDHDV